MEQIKTILITQARVGSTRLPGKVLKKINNQSLLEIHLNRLKKCKQVSKIMVATTTNEHDDLLIAAVEKSGIPYFRGSENDVLERYYSAAKPWNPTWVVRVTSDCPLIDPVLVDQVIQFAEEKNVDYCSNTLEENFPDGQDVEIFKFTALQKAFEEAKLPSEREHVTPYIRNHSTLKGQDQFTSVAFPSDANFGNIRMTVDEQADFELIEKLILGLGVEQSWLKYTNFILENKLQKVNEHITRNEGLIKSLLNDQNNG